MSKEKGWHYEHLIVDKANEALDTLVRRFTSSNTIEVERTTIKEDEFTAIRDYINLLIDDATERQKLRDSSPQSRTTLSAP